MTAPTGKLMAEFVGQDKDATKVPETIPIRHPARPLGIVREAPPKPVRKRVNLAQPEYDDTETEPTTGRPTDDITAKQPWRSLGFSARHHLTIRRGKFRRCLKTVEGLLLPIAALDKAVILKVEGSLTSGAA